jgi:hypothetical protein
MRQETGRPMDTLRGGSRALIFLYGLLALSATVRSVYQLVVRALLGNEPPLPYVLSAVAAAIYIIACIGFGQRSPQAWRVTLAVCAIELAGVLLVGVLTLINPALFPRATVWSEFGIGYFFLPLALPIAGLIWLLRPETRQAYGVAKSV